MLAELREYTITPGRTQQLLDQFRIVSLPLFDQYKITSYGPWLRNLTKGEQLVYVLEFDDEADREAKWSAFCADPLWQAAQRTLADDIPLVAGSTTTMMSR